MAETRRSVIVIHVSGGLVQAVGHLGEPVAVIICDDDRLDGGCEGSEFWTEETSDLAQWSKAEGSVLARVNKELPGWAWGLLGREMEIRDPDVGFGPAFARMEATNRALDDEATPAKPLHPATFNTGLNQRIPWTHDGTTEDA